MSGQTRSEAWREGRGGARHDLVVMKITRRRKCKGERTDATPMQQISVATTARKTGMALKAMWP